MLVKILAVFTVTCFVQCSGQGEFNSEYIDATEAKMAKIFTLKFLDYYFNKNENPEIKDGRLFPIFPPFEEDTMQLVDAAITIPEDSPMSETIYGNASFCDVTLSGLTTVWNDLRGDVNETGPNGNLNFTLTIDRLNFTGNDDVLVYVDGKKTKLTATETFHFGFNGLYFNAILEVANISIFSKINLTNAFLDLTIDAFDVYFENGAVNDSRIPEDSWDEVSLRVGEGFAELWEEKLEPLLEFLLTFVVKDLIKECRLVDFVFQNFTCMGAPSGKDGLQQLISQEMADLLVISDLAVCPAPQAKNNEKPSNSANSASTVPEKKTPKRNSPSAQRDGGKSGAQIQIQTMRIMTLTSILFFVVSSNFAK